MTQSDRLSDLQGVHMAPFAVDGTALRTAREQARLLLEAGVEYSGASKERVPWLVALHPFVLSPDLLRRIERLGAAVFALLDAAQHLYAAGDPLVRAHLDFTIPADLLGLQLERRVMTFRLDVGIEDGRPQVTEIEEIYGNAGKMAAMQDAYGVDNDALFRSFADLKLTHIGLDDSLPTYRSEVELLQRHLARQHGMAVRLENFSAFAVPEGSVVWRFCRTPDLAQYPLPVRRAIVNAPCAFINPLFHGYGIKTMLALPFHPGLADALRAAIGEQHFATLREGVPESTLLGPDTPPEAWEELAAGHSRLVLKIADAPGFLEYTWGSRGVFFGDRSRARWQKALDAARAGSIPGVPEARGVRYMVSRLVESDRFDVPFLHPADDQLALMTRARVRLTPIFFRHGGEARLMAGHATFVNTSRKIHLGSHAVCAPLDWVR